MFTCVKKYPEICVAHRNWRVDTHCALIHGYARTVEITIACHFLDPEAQWVFDLGKLRSVKNFLVDQWDHRCLISSDDPLLEDFKALEEKGALALNVMDVAKGWGPSLEQSCRFLADHIQPLVAQLSGNRCWLARVEIWEKSENRAALDCPQPAPFSSP